MTTIDLELSSPPASIDNSTALAWPRWKLRAFRLAFVAVVLATATVAPLLMRYLYFQPIVRTVTAVVRPASFTVTDGLLAIGAFIIGGGDTAFVENPAPRYATRAAVTAAAYFLGFFLVSVVITTAWSLADTHRTQYTSLDDRTRVYVRYLLAAAMMLYGMTKVIPTQFGFLPPGELLRPLGQLSRFDMLWTFMSVSPGYTMFAGGVEVLAALLLFSARTTLLGALLAAGALTNVIALDIAYDLRGPLLTAILLLLLAVIILAPYVQPLWKFLLQPSVSDGRKEPSRGFRFHRWRYAPIAKAIVLVLMLGQLVQAGLQNRRAYFGAGRPVYGLFDVETIGSSGARVNGGTSDGRAWKRVGSAGRTDSNGLIVQFADGNVRQFRLEDDPSQRTWKLRQRTDEIASLRYDLQADGTVFLDGLIGKEPVKMRLRPVDPARFPLLDWR